MRLLFLLAATILAAACSGGGPSGAAAPGGVVDGGSNGDGGGPSDGATPAPDPDADDGPLWDGRLPAAPKLIARGVSMDALTDDEAVVYATTAGVTALPLEGGDPVTVATAKNDRVYSAGRAALAFAADGTVTGWSRATGARVVAGMSGTIFGTYESLLAYPTASGDRVLLAQATSDTTADLAKLKRWLLDVTTLSATPLSPPTVGVMVGCAARAETITCVQRISDQRSEMWSVDASGLHSRGSIADYAFRTHQVGDTLFAEGRSGIYRASLATNEPPSTFVSGLSAFMPLEGGWIGTMDATSLEIKVMHADGSDAKTVASGAIIAPLDSEDTTRVRWLPICDRAGGKDSNLRVVDPATGKTVAVSKSCQLRAITYSDNFAFIIDDWVGTPNDPILSGTGTPTIVDLRDGSKRGNPTGEDYFAHSALPLGKSRLLIRWLAFGGFSDGCFYDGHTDPSTRGAVFDGPITQSASYDITKSGRGVLFHGRRADDTGTDLYYGAF